MPATSQNGWSANDRSVIASYQLPGGKVALRKGDVSVLLLWCADRWHETVEPLVWPGIWGYAERTVRGSSTTLSNHASGTAIDLNAPRHPLGARGTFSPAQVAAIRSILAFCEGTVRWGGDYASRADEMHLEINAGAAAVRRVADKIRAAQTGAPPGGGFLMALSDAEQGELLGIVRNLSFQLFTGEGGPQQPGWRTWEGGTRETLTVVDYLRRNNVEVAALRAAVEQLAGLAAQGGGATADEIRAAVADAIREGLVEVDITVRGQDGT